MNGEDQQSSLLDYYLQRHTLRRDTTPRPKRTYRGIDLIGFDEIKEEEEEKPEEEVGGLRGLLSGLGTGLLEPLGFIDPEAAS